MTAPVSAPVNLCGISLALLGFANSGCEGGSTSTVSGAGGGGGSDNGNVMGVGNVSTGSGNTVTAPVSTPVNVCGVSLGLLGFSNSGCEGGSTSCIGDQCTPPCEGSDCNTPPPCERDHCNAPPPCEGSDCQPPPCQGNHCAPPPCHGDCTPPGPTTPPHGTIPTVPGTTTAVTTATMPSSGLPTTGADLLLLGVAALGSIGVGAGTVALARRRRNGEAS